MSTRRDLESRSAAPRPWLKTVGRKEWVDFAKGVAIVLVVVYHSFLFLRSAHFPVAGMGRVKTGLEMFPMPMFFLIAGLFHFRVLDWTLRQTWKRRLLGYLYLYVLWSVLRFAFYYVVPNVRSDGAGATATGPLSLLGILVWPISSYWFILALLVFTFLLWSARRLPSWVPLAVAGALSLIFSAGLVTTTNVGWDRMGEYLLFFLLGACFSKRIFTAVQHSRTWLLVASGAVYAATAGAAAFVHGAAHVPGLVLLGELAAVAFGATVSVRLVRVRALGWVGHLGARSLQIYLMHIFVIAALTAAVAAVPFFAHLPGRSVVVPLAMVVAVVLLTLLLSRLLSGVGWLFVPPRWLQRTRRSRRTVSPAAPSTERAPQP